MMTTRLAAVAAGDGEGPPSQRHQATGDGRKNKVKGGPSGAWEPTQRSSVIFTWSMSGNTWFSPTMPQMKV